MNLWGECCFLLVSNGRRFFLLIILFFGMFLWINLVIVGSKFMVLVSMLSFIFVGMCFGYDIIVGVLILLF